MLILSCCIALIIFSVSSANGVARSAISAFGWEQGWRASSDQPLKLHIALRQEDDGKAIEKRLASVSYPHSSHFRQYLGPDEAISLSKSSQESVRSVEQWLMKSGLEKNMSLVGSIFEVDTTIKTAEQLLNASYFVYLNGAQHVTRTELYFLPEDVAGHVDFITPTTAFPKTQKPMNSSFSLKCMDEITSAINFKLLKADEFTAQASAISTVETIIEISCGAEDLATPTCVREAYGIGYNAKPNRTTFAVYGTEAASFSATDLKTYLSTYNEPAARADAQYEVLNKSNLSEGSGVEAKFETALDTQTLMGLAWPARGILYEYGGVFGPNPGQDYDNFVQFLQDLIRNKTVPSVVSFSESMPEDMMDPDYARRLCCMMAQVGTRGVTLVFSSGDNGPNGDQPSGKHSQIFEPEFPASCPWVTAVGGTTNLASETAATKSTLDLAESIGYIASGGGFSNLFLTPSYQAAAVGNYTSKHIPKSYYSVSGFNAKGRGIPDVSAFSTNFPTVVDQLTLPIGGTSASTPLWAAVVALLNDYEASKGRPSLGFMNPWLYSLRSGLKDITTGGNNAGSCYKLMGCDLPETLGYNVTEGWDPVTGLGSPLFAALVDALEDVHYMKSY